MSDKQNRRRHRRGQAPAGGAVAVIGLGRFGSQVAVSLIRIGHEVLAIDDDPEVVQKWSDQLTYVAQADSTDENALRQLGLADFAWVVVALGSALQASVLTVLALTELKVPKIWGRAASDQHAKILSAVGAHHVIFPEAAMGERVARTSSSVNYSTSSNWATTSPSPRPGRRPRWPVGGSARSG